MVSDVRILTIGEVAAKHTVSFRTLRFYEQIGLLSPTRAGSSRLYSTKDLVRLQLILKGKKLGFTLDEIGVLIKSGESREEGPAPTILDALPVARIEAQIIQLEEKRESLSAAIQELHVALQRTG